MKVFSTQLYVFFAWNVALNVWLLIPGRVMLKRRMQPSLAAASGLANFAIAVTFGVEWNGPRPLPFLYWLVVPLFGVIPFIGTHLLRFCDACGRTNLPSPPGVPSRHCQTCGNPL